jgi:cytochrome c biogenesis protein CcmG/thiol:disulfide interchange protein DsbE
MRRIALLLAAGAVVAVLAVGFSQIEGPGKAPTSRRINPETVRRSLAGSPPPLAEIHSQGNHLLGGGRSAFKTRLAALRGHPVIVNLWAAWCAPCRVEFPSFQSSSVVHGRRVAFLGIDTSDNHGDALRFLRRFPVSYPSYVDDHGRISTDLGVQALPTTVFYDRRGRVAYVHQGVYPSRGQLEQDIRRYALES